MFLVVAMVRKGEKKQFKSQFPQLFKFSVFSNRPTIPTHPPDY